MDFSLVHHVNWFKGYGQNTSKHVNTCSADSPRVSPGLEKGFMNAVDAGDEFLRFGSGCFGIDFFLMWISLTPAPLTI
jgi:hypothetical protein